MGVLSWLLLAACNVSAPAAEDTGLTPTQTSTVQETSTIIWFPPTDTPRPVVTPTLLPTRNLHPGVGTQVFSDLFTKDSNWQVASDDSGSIAYGNNELTLAIRQPKVTMATLNRTLYMGDFYLEVTANPSLCRGMDAYGLLLRASTSADTYRLLFSCSGQIRLERVKNSKLTVLQDWIYSGQVPPGSPAVLHIGVWALRNEMRIFVNDFYQFSFSDPIFPTGGLGFFARSAGDSALTVSFSNLEIYGLNPDEILPTETPTVTPPPTSTVTRIAPHPTYLPW
jgi:hypothetical protein